MNSFSLHYYVDIQSIAKERDDLIRAGGHEAAIVRSLQNRLIAYGVSEAKASAISWFD